MNKIKIEKRNLDTKPRVLREKNIIPGTIYGPDLKSMAIQATANELSKATHRNGEVYSIRQGNKTIYARMDETQVNPVSHEYIHFSLVQLPKGVENEVEVPVELIGKAPGKKEGGILVQMRDHLLLSGTPKSMPDTIKLDISKINLGDKLTVEDIKIPKGVHISDDETANVLLICKTPGAQLENTSDEVQETEVIGSEEEIKTNVS